MNTNAWILFHSSKDKTKWRILQGIPPAALLNQFIIDQSDNESNNSAQLQKLPNAKVDTTVKAHDYQTFEKKEESPIAKKKCNVFNG